MDSWKKALVSVTGLVIMCVFISVVSHLGRKMEGSNGSGNISGHVERNALEILGRHLIQEMNRSVDPCKDFYLYACGGYLAKNPPRNGTDQINHNIIGMRLEEKRIKELVFNSTGYSKPIIEMKKFLKTCLDDENEESELASLKRLINGIGGWQLLQPEVWKANDFDWVKVAAEVTRSTDTSAIIGLETGNKSTIILVTQPTFGLSIEDLTNPLTAEESISDYKDSIHSVARELGSIQGEYELNRAIQNIIDFEIRLAKIAKLSNSTGPPLSLNSSGEIGIHLNKFIDILANTYGIEKGEKIMVERSEYWDQLLNILREEKEETVGNYLVWRFINSVINKETEETAEERKGACVEKVKDVFRKALRYLYQEEKVDKESKKEIGEITSNIFKAFKKSLEEAGLDSEAKAKFIAKIDGIRTIAVEDKETVEEYYKGLKFGDSFVENQVILNRFIIEKNLLGLLLLDPNLSALYGTEAKYLPYFNIISIPVTYLHPPFFWGKHQKHQNYARLGFTIGHEIAHSLQFNSSVSLGWDDFAKVKFRKKIKCFTDKFGTFRTSQLWMNVNGELTSKENIADMDGLRVSWIAYQDASQQGQEKGLGLEQFTNEQLFFIGYAQWHCESITNDLLANQIKTDPHSPSEIRVNGILKEFDEFAKAFNCSVDDGMNPAEKCVDW